MSFSKTPAESSAGNESFLKSPCLMPHGIREAGTSQSEELRKLIAEVEEPRNIINNHDKVMGEAGTTFRSKSAAAQSQLLMAGRAMHIREAKLIQFLHFSIESAWKPIGRQAEYQSP